MYNEPKNTYEVAMNEVYRNMRQFIFAELEPVTANLETIYRKLPYELQMELGDYFYQLFYLTSPEKI